MRKYYSIGDNGRLVPSDSLDESSFVLIDKKELDELERKLNNKTEEADRLYKKLTGDNLPFRLIKLDIVHESFSNEGTYIGQSGETKSFNSKYFVTIGLPVSHLVEKEQEASVMVMKHFNKFVHHKRCRMHFLPKSGWSVQLELTQSEYLDFKLPVTL